MDQEKLDEVLHNYCRSMGIKEASNLYQYKDLQAQQAESPNSIQKLTKLLGALLTVTSTAKVKYKYLRQTFTLLTQTWGSELLAAHREAETSLPPGRAADAAGVLLKHWRRCAPSDVAWGKLISRYGEVSSKVLEVLGKRASWDGKEKGKRKRVLKNNISEVSMDSQGYPSMTAMNPALCEKEGEDESEEESSSCDMEGLPPCLKKDWKALAMKKPAAAIEHEPSESLMKTSGGL